MSNLIFRAAGRAGRQAGLLRVEGHPFDRVFKCKLELIGDKIELALLPTDQQVAYLLSQQGAHSQEFQKSSRSEGAYWSKQYLGAHGCSRIIKTASNFIVIFVITRKFEVSRINRFTFM